MEQDVETVQRRICNTCLSSDRDIIILNEQSVLFQIFRLLTYDFAGEVSIFKITILLHAQ